MRTGAVVALLLSVAAVVAISAVVSLEGGAEGEGGQINSPVSLCGGTICVTDVEARQVAEKIDDESDRWERKAKRLQVATKRKFGKMEKGNKRLLSGFQSSIDAKLKKVRSQIGNLEEYVKLQVANIQSMRGPTGIRGPRGLQGIVGKRGVVGPQGVRGQLGNTGPRGPVGYVGPVGPQGPKGVPQGLACIHVASGQSGNGDDARSSVSCPGGYRMTGCSAFTWWRHVDGAFVSGDTCIAQNGQAGNGVWAYGVCCKVAG